MRRTIDWEDSTNAAGPAVHDDGRVAGTVLES
jgi:hypothetical protein